MNILLDPNVAYLFLVGGFLLAILALFAPGTGFIEAGAIVILVLAGYSIANHTINWWALVILAVGVFPFLLALRSSRRWVFLIFSMAALVIGSIFLIRDPQKLVAVDPVLAGIVSIITVSFLWFIIRKAIEALGQPPSQSLEKLLGKVGVARVDIQREGTVYVGGEEWSARSSGLIPAGSHVRVVGREGLVLMVESVSPKA